MVKATYLIGNVCPEGSEQKTIKNPHWGVNIIYRVHEDADKPKHPETVPILARCMTPCDLEKCKYHTGKFEYCGNEASKSVDKEERQK